MINIDNNRSINNINNNINNCGKNFRTPLTPLHRGGLGGLHKSSVERFYNSDMREIHKDNLDGLHKGCLKELNKGCMDRTYSKMIKDIYSEGLRYAFSLIELSIVLIIIGLLVAGVTGGKSLIDSARSRALINEIREYERAVWTFRAARDRFPGDVMNYGTFGDYSNYYSSTCTTSCSQPYYAYKKTDFAAPYDTGSFTPNYNSAPFVDLYTEGIIDFKPLGNTKTADKKSTTKGVPNSKNLNDVYIYHLYGVNHSWYSPTVVQSKDYSYGRIGGEGNIGISLYYKYDTTNKDHTLYKVYGFEPKMLQAVDKKFDDGNYDKGRFRGGCCKGTLESNDSCTYSSYNNSIQNSAKCREFMYAL